MSIEKLCYKREFANHFQVTQFIPHLKVGVFLLFNPDNNWCWMTSSFREAGNLVDFYLKFWKIFNDIIGRFD
jgi:hypothetical protein